MITNGVNVAVTSWVGEPDGITNNPSWLNGINLPTTSTVPWMNWPVTYHGSNNWVLNNTSPLINNAANLLSLYSITNGGVDFYGNAVGSSGYNVGAVNKNQ